MSISCCGIEWANSSALIYLPLGLAAVALLAYRTLRTKKAITALAAATHRHKLLLNFSWPREIIKIVLSTIALLFLFLALLNPQWDKKEELVPQEGRDVFVALDISRSMLAADCKPNRLACAKNKIKQLLDKLSTERVGLILFSGTSFVQCPLTQDHAAFYMLLDHIDVETISSGSTVLDQAILQALRAFKVSADHKHKLLVVVTDGEDFSVNLAAAKQQAAQAGMHILALGVGTPQGAPVPIIDALGKQQGHQRDKKNNVVISKINEGILVSLAQDTGGIYRQITRNDDDIHAVVAHVQSYEKEKLYDKKISRYQEQYPYFVAVALCCLIIEWLL